MKRKKIKEETTQKIKKATLFLLGEQKRSDLTVEAIISVADVSRATFYNYYASVKDVTHEAIQDLIEEIVNDTHDISEFRTDNEKFINEISRVLTILRKNSALFSVVMSRMYNETEVFSDFDKLFQSRYFPDLDDKKYFNNILMNKKQADILSHFRRAGTYFAIQHWLDSGCTMSEHEMAYNLLLFNGVLNNDK